MMHPEEHIRWAEHELDMADKEGKWACQQARATKALAHATLAQTLIALRNEKA